MAPLMKYKNIYSAIHNFGHSFLSLMNYVDGVYVADQLWDMRSNEVDITIDWLLATFSPVDQATPEILKSIQQYASTLEKHLQSHNIDPAKITDLKLIIPSKRKIHMLARDDRGKEYKIYVSEIK